MKPFQKVIPPEKQPMVKKTFGQRSFNVITNCECIGSYLTEIYEKFKGYFDLIAYGIDFYEPFLVEPILPKNTMMICCKIPSSIVYDSDCSITFNEDEFSFDGTLPQEAMKISIRLKPDEIPKIHYIRRFNLLSISDERESLNLKDLTFIVDRLLNILAAIRPARVSCKSIIDVTIGTDPEFELLFASGDVATARSLRIPPGWEIGHDTSGNQLEVRPRPSTDPFAVVSRVWMLLNEVVAEKKNVLPCISGHTYPLGGHVHIGHPFINTNIFPVEMIIELIDDFMGDLVELSGRARANFKKRKSYRIKPYGVEYRTLPSAIFYSKYIALTTFTIIKELSQRLLDGKEIIYHLPPRIEDLSEITGLSRSEIKKYIGELTLLKEKISKGRNVLISDIQPPTS